jgi:hypothetical protein
MSLHPIERSNAVKVRIDHKGDYCASIAVRQPARDARFDVSQYPVRIAGQ